MPPFFFHTTHKLNLTTICHVTSNYCYSFFALYNIIIIIPIMFLIHFLRNSPSSSNFSPLKLPTFFSSMALQPPRFQKLSAKHKTLFGPQIFHMGINKPPVFMLFIIMVVSTTIVEGRTLSLISAPGNSESQVY